MALVVGINSYVDEATASVYCELEGLAGLPTESAEALLKRATLALDRLYGARFIGYRAQIDQALAWPRFPTQELSLQDGEYEWYSTDSHGNYRSFAGIPAEVQHAVTELAVMLMEQTDIYAQPEPRVTQESIDVGVKQSQSFAGGGHRVDPMHKITLILSPLLTNSVIKLVR